jgi:hypothetical protein
MRNLFVDFKKNTLPKEFVARLEMAAYCTAIGCNKPDLYWIGNRLIRTLFEYSNKGGRSKIAVQFNASLNDKTLSSSI